MMEYADDLEYITVEDALKQYNWVKCEEVEIKVTTWRAING